jgi:ribosome biogenesis GTPase
VIEASSGTCRVDYHGVTLLCELRGNLKEAQTGFVNPVAVGDWVLVSKNSAERGLVEAVLPRHSLLSRPYSPDEGVFLEDLHQILAANVDRLLIVASWREPYLWPALIDRYLIAAQRNRIEAVVCINKIDLIEDQGAFDDFFEVYRRLGQEMILTSVVTRQGIDALEVLLKRGTTVLAGVSGVGKSSLLTEVQPNLNLKTGRVSERGLFTGQGRHTTTQSSLIRLDNGGIVIDTPGVRSFGIAGITLKALADWYPEMAPHLPNCRFRDCLHISEPDCAVLEGVKHGKISRLRYKNYTQLLDELR